MLLWSSQWLNSMNEHFSAFSFPAFLSMSQSWAQFSSLGLSFWLQWYSPGFPPISVTSHCYSSFQAHTSSIWQLNVTVTQVLIFGYIFYKLFPDKLTQAYKFSYHVCITYSLIYISVARLPMQDQYVQQPTKYPFLYGKDQIPGPASPQPNLSSFLLNIVFFRVFFSQWMLTPSIYKHRCHPWYNLLLPHYSHD